MPKEADKSIVPSADELEKAKREAVVEVIAGKVVSEGSRRDDVDLVRSIYQVFVEVSIYLALIFDEIRKEERE